MESQFVIYIKYADLSQISWNIRVCIKLVRNIVIVKFVLSNEALYNTHDVCAPAGDIRSDCGATGGSRERSGPGSAAHLLPAAFRPAGKDLPEGKHLSLLDAGRS